MCEVQVEGLVTKVGRTKCYSPSTYNAPAYNAFYLQIDSEEHGLVNVMVQVRGNQKRKRCFSGDRIRVTAQKIKEGNWISVTLRREYDIIDNHGEKEYVEENTPKFSEQMINHLNAKVSVQELNNDHCAYNFEQLLMAFHKKDEIVEPEPQYLVMFGKHRNKHITEVPLGYIKWIYEQVEKEVSTKLSSKQNELDIASKQEEKMEREGENLLDKINSFMEE